MTSGARRSRIRSPRAGLGAFDGDRPVGAAVFHDMRQWWSGRAVPMAGVASVRVAPEDRGRGVARRLMAAVLAEVAARGYPLSALYPATMPARLRRAAPGDAEAVLAVVGQVHEMARDSGPITWDAAFAGTAYMLDSF